MVIVINKGGHIMSDKEEFNNIETDYNYSRQTYYDLIEKGRESLDMMIEVARESEHPRAFEVLAGLLKNTADINDKLMDLNKKNKDISQNDIKQLEKTTNNLFVGSTAELQKMLQNNDETVSNVVDITPKLK